MLQLNKVDRPDSAITNTPCRDAANLPSPVRLNGIWLRQRHVAVLLLGVALLIVATVIVTTYPASPKHQRATAGSTSLGLAALASLPATASTDITSFPDAATTGVPAGTRLTRVPTNRTSGPGWEWNGRAVVVTRADTTLEALDIDGAVINQYDGLMLRNSRIRCTGENDWCLSLGAHSQVLHTEIGGGADGKTYGRAVGIWSGRSDANNLIVAVNVHSLIDDLRIDGGTTVADSYIHDVAMGDPVLNLATGEVTTNDHSDGLMSTGGGNIVVRHNRFEGGNTASLFVQRDVTDLTKRIGSVLIENNLFVNVHKNDSDSSFGVDIENKGIDGPIILRVNTFTHSSWTVGPIQVPPGSTESGNIFADGSPTS